MRGSNLVVRMALRRQQASCSNKVASFSLWHAAATASTTTGRLSRQPSSSVVMMVVGRWQSSALPSKEEDEKSSTNKDAFAPQAQPETTTTYVLEKQEINVQKDKPWLWHMGLPSLVPEWKRMFAPSTLFADISAGLTVGCIAVPLSLAIAVASGVPPEVGLVTAAVSGVAGGLVGGTTLAITGPAAAISLLVVSAVQEHGLIALPLITATVGGLQVASGVTRLGVWAKLVPVSVIAGFTTGVGAMILSGQIPKALGLVAPAGLNPLETLLYVGEHVSAINPAAAGLAGGTAAAMYFLPKLHAKMPWALLAVGTATAVTQMYGLDVAIIGSIPSGLSAFALTVPGLPSLESWPSLVTTTLLIYSMTSAESLLSCAALEKMKKTPYPHNPDQELIGQGWANVAAGMFGGMPVTSVIARSGLNVRCNAESRLPALVQSAFVFSSVVYFSDTIAQIPMAALSGMLITTGLGMLSPTEFKHCFAVQKLDAIPFVTTIGGMIAFGLAEGIGIGCLSAWALNYDYGKMAVKEMALPHKQEVSPPPKFIDVVVPSSSAASATTQAQDADNDDDQHLDFHRFNVPQVPGAFSPTQITIGWQLEGPINFGSMFQIDDLIHRMQELNEAEGDTVQERVLVLDMQETTSVEFTGVEELVNRLLDLKDQSEQQYKIPTSIEMWNCHDDLQNALAQCDPTQTIARYSHQHYPHAPYHFPPKEKAPVREPVPMWYDSPNFRPDAK